MRQTRRVRRLDQGWGRNRTVGVVVGQSPTDVDRLRTQFVEFITAHGDHKLAARLDADHTHWIRSAPHELDAHAARVIRADTVDPAESPTAWIRSHVNGREDDDLPVIVHVGPTWVGMNFHHSVGDAMSFDTVFTAFATGDFERFARLEPAATFGQLARATVSRLPEHARAWRQIARAAAPAEPEPLTNVPQTPRIDTAGVSVPPEDLAHFHRWRKSEMPGLTVTSLFTAAIARALLAEGNAIDTQSVTSPFDVRRFLDTDGAMVYGNVAKPIVVHADPTDPRSVQQALTATTETARALPAILQSTLRRRPLTDPEPDVRRPARLAVSSVPGLPSIHHMPWADPEVVRLFACGANPDSTGINAFPATIGGWLQCHVSFDANTLDPPAVQRALDRLQSVPDLF